MTNWKLYASNTLARAKSPLLLGLGTLVAVCAINPAAQAKPDDSVTLESELRICAAQDELPYSGKDQPGFENSIAYLVGEALKRPVTYVWADKPAIYLVRDWLDKNKCDVVMGVDTGDPRLLTTDPYYRTGYAFIYRKDRNLDIKSWDSADLKKLDRFATVFGSPPEVMLKEIDKFEGTFNYMHSLTGFKSRRNQYVRVDPEHMVQEVAQGKADIAVIWAPEAARYVQQSSVPLEMVLIPDNAARSDGQPVPHHYSQSMGVRKDDKELLADLNRAIERRAGAIKAVLEKEGIPLLPLHDGRNATAQAEQP